MNNTSEENRSYLAGLPSELRIKVAGVRLLLCHGSPRRTNEFLWESTTSDAFLSRLLRMSNSDVILATHTGIKWRRKLPSGLFVNVGVLGRPENDGRTNVWYGLLTIYEGRPRCDGIHPGRLRPRTSGRGDGRRGPAERIQRDDSHRLVDDVP